LTDQQAKYNTDYFIEKEKSNWKLNLTKNNKDLYFQPKTKDAKGNVKIDDRVTEW